MQNIVLGHYRLLERLGTGGMGEVWLAEDERLGRRVAVKRILQQSVGGAAVERLRREARAAAALSHPNIVTVHAVEEDAGGTFLVMELVRGQLLSEVIPPGGLPLPPLLELAVPLADALAAAHEAGVVHRDLKPANVMVTASGVLKVLDFGLARLRPPAGSEHTQVAGAPAPPPLTETGTVPGTLPYMSPEQLHGREIDARSDIFSLGVVLHEMATGRRPFAGESAAGLITAILRDEPPEMLAHGDPARERLAAIVRLCLAKDPDERAASAREVRDRLAELRDAVRRDTTPPPMATSPTLVVAHARRRAVTGTTLALAAGLLVVLALGTTLLTGRRQTALDSRQAAATGEPYRGGAAPAAKPGRKVIAVLPFANLGPADERYFAEGLSDEVISRLAGVPGLGVISRTSAARFGGGGRSTRETGQALGAQYLLAGSVRWAGRGDDGRVRVSPQLIRVADDTYLWAETYDRPAREVFGLQSEIANAVAHELGVELLGEAATVARPTSDLAAYRAYLAGRQAFRGAPEDVAKLRLAAQMLERSVASDPRFAAAWAELSHLRSYLYFNPGYAPEVPRVELLHGAEEALRHATEIAPGDPEVEIARAYYRYYGFYDYASALEALAAVRAVRPDDPEVARLEAYVLRRQGRLADASAAMARVLALDPQNAALRSDYAETLAARRRFAEADRTYADALALFPAEAPMYVDRADLWVRWRGDVAGAERLLDSAPPSPEVDLARLRLLRYRRAWAPLRQRLAALAPTNNSQRTARTCWPGLPTKLAGDEAAARTHLEACVALLRGRDDSGSLARSAEALALLGRGDEAQATAERAVAAAAADGFTGPATRQSLAAVAAWGGRPAAAVAVLRDLLRTEYQRPMTPAMLRLEAVWDPLRADPGFQALLRE